MAQGTLTLFEEFSLNIGDGSSHDLDADTYKLALVSNSIVGMAATVTPLLTDFTEVTGTNYTAGGEALTTTWTEAAGVADFKHTGGTITWSQHASGPTNIKTGIIYNTTGSFAICFIDFTTDGGTTTIRIVDGDITWTPEAAQNRIFSVS
jgi:hypothetical protein